MPVPWGIKVKFVIVSQFLGLGLCSHFGSVSGPFRAPGLIVSLGERKKKRQRKNKPPADFKPTERVLLVFLDAAGRWGLGFTFLPSYDFVRMGTRSGLQYSQLPSIQSRSSVSCWVPTVHLHQAWAFNPPVAPRSMCYASSLLFTSPPWLEPTIGQAAPVSLWASSASPVLVSSSNQPQGKWYLEQPESAVGPAESVSLQASSANQPQVEQGE